MRQSIVKYKLFLFYSFAFAISWTFWFLMASVYQGGATIDVMTLTFSTIGGLGPLISLGILEKLSGESRPSQKIWHQGEY